MPYNQNVIKLVNEKKAKGFRIILATASNEILADRIAAHLRLFDDVFASSKNVNLSKNTKRDVLVSNYGINGFDYIGNSEDDLIVWKAANNAFLVNTSSRVKSLANKEGNVTKVFDEPKSNSWLKAMRIHHWTKNLLVFVPLFLSHQFIDVKLLFDGFQVFLYFGFFCIFSGVPCEC